MFVNWIQDETFLARAQKEGKSDFVALFESFVQKVETDIIKSNLTYTCCLHGRKELVTLLFNKVSSKERLLIALGSDPEKNPLRPICMKGAAEFLPIFADFLPREDFFDFLVCDYEAWHLAYRSGHRELFRELKTYLNPDELDLFVNWNGGALLEEARRDDNQDFIALLESFLDRDVT
jgi:hypothetical protein